MKSHCLDMNDFCVRATFLHISRHCVAMWNQCTSVFSLQANYKFLIIWGRPMDGHAVGVRCIGNGQWGVTCNEPRRRGALNHCRRWAGEKSKGGGSNGVDSSSFVLLWKTWLFSTSQRWQAERKEHGFTLTIASVHVLSRFCFYFFILTRAPWGS